MWSRGTALFLAGWLLWGSAVSSRGELPAHRLPVLEPPLALFRRDRNVVPFRFDRLHATATRCLPEEEIWALVPSMRFLLVWSDGPFQLREARGELSRLLHTDRLAGWAETPGVFRRLAGGWHLIRTASDATTALVLQPSGGEPVTFRVGLLAWREDDFYWERLERRVVGIFDSEPFPVEEYRRLQEETAVPESVRAAAHLLPWEPTPELPRWERELRRSLLLWAILQERSRTDHAWSSFSLAIPEGFSSVAVEGERYFLLAPRDAPAVEGGQTRALLTVSGPGKLVLRTRFRYTPPVVERPRRYRLWLREGPRLRDVFFFTTTLDDLNGVLLDETGRPLGRERTVEWAIPPGNHTLILEADAELLIRWELLRKIPHWRDAERETVSWPKELPREERGRFAQAVVESLWGSPIRAMELWGEITNPVWQPDQRLWEARLLAELGQGTAALERLAEAEQRLPARDGSSREFYRERLVQTRLLVYRLAGEDDQAVAWTRGQLDTLQPPPPEASALSREEWLLWTALAEGLVRLRSEESLLLLDRLWEHRPDLQELRLLRRSVWNEDTYWDALRPIERMAGGARLFFDPVEQLSEDAEELTVAAALAPTQVGAGPILFDREYRIVLNDPWLRMHSLADATVPIGLEVELDGERFSLVQLQDEESFILAAKPGEHRLRVRSKEGRRVRRLLADAAILDDTANRQRWIPREMYPVPRAEEPARLLYEVESPIGGWIRLLLRLHDGDEAELRVQVDDGAPQLVRCKQDPTAPLESRGALPIVLPIEPGRHYVQVVQESGSGRVYAQLALRSPRRAPTPIEEVQRLHLESTPEVSLLRPLLFLQELPESALIGYLAARSRRLRELPPESPGRVPILWERAQALFALRRWEAAHADLVALEAFPLSPDQQEALDLALMDVELQMGRFSDLEQLRLAPRWKAGRMTHGAALRLARLWIARGEFALAAELLARIPAGAPEFTEARFLEAVARWRNGEAETARLLLAQFLRLPGADRPFDPVGSGRRRLEATLLLAALEVQQGNLAAGRNWLETARRSLLPERPLDGATRRWVLWLQGRLAATERHLSEATTDLLAIAEWNAEWVQAPVLTWQDAYLDRFETLRPEWEALPEEAVQGPTRLLSPFVPATGTKLEAHYLIGDETGSDLRARVVGPTLLRLDVRPLHRSDDRRPLSGLIKVFLNGVQIGEERFTANRPSDRFVFYAISDWVPGDREQSFYSLPTGEHRVRVRLEGFMGAVRLYVARPLPTFWFLDRREGKPVILPGAGEGSTGVITAQLRRAYLEALWLPGTPSNVARLGRVLRALNLRSGNVLGIMERLARRRPEEAYELGLWYLGLGNPAAAYRRLLNAGDDAQAARMRARAAVQLHLYDEAARDYRALIAATDGNPAPETERIEAREALYETARTYLALGELVADFSRRSEWYTRAYQIFERLTGEWPEDRRFWTAWWEIRRRTRWQRIAAVGSSAGAFSLSRPVESPLTVEEAILPPFWEENGAVLLDPDQIAGYALTVQEPIRIRLQTHLVGPQDAMDRTVFLRVWKDGSFLGRFWVKPGGLSEYTLESLSAGTHLIEVQSEGLDERGALRLRLLSDRPIGGEASPEASGWYPVRGSVQVPYFLATPETPVRLTVAGPAVFRVLAFVPEDAGPTQLQLRADGETDEWSQTLTALPGAETEAACSLQGGEIYRITIEPIDPVPTAVRLYVRVPQEDLPVEGATPVLSGATPKQFGPALWAWRPERRETLRPPVPQPTLGALRLSGEFGTLEVAVGWGKNVEEEFSEGEYPGYAETEIVHRRRFEPGPIYHQLSFRLRQGLVRVRLAQQVFWFRPIFRLEERVYFPLPWGFRGTALLRGDYQRVVRVVQGTTEFAVEDAAVLRAQLELSRSIRLRPGLSWISRLEMDRRQFAIDAHRVVASLTAAKDVFSAYAFRHDWIAHYDTQLWWRPYLDVILYQKFHLQTNRGLNALDPDYFYGRLGVRKLFRSSVDLHFYLELRRRFADVYRATPSTERQIGFRTKLGYWWSVVPTELTIAGQYRFSGSSRQGFFFVGWSIYWTQGRGLADFYPGSIDFEWEKGAFFER